MTDAMAAKARQDGKAAGSPSSRQYSTGKPSLVGLRQDSPISSPPRAFAIQGSVNQASGTHPISSGNVNGIVASPTKIAGTSPSRPPIIHFPIDIGPTPTTPLSKRRSRIRPRKSAAPEPPLLHPISVVQLSPSLSNALPSFGLLSLDDWLATYEHDAMQFESLGAFAEIKLQEALRLCSKFPHPMNRFRAAVVCNLLERVAFALATSDTFKRYQWSIFALRDELLRMILSDLADDDVVASKDTHTPRAISFFIQKMPYFIELRLENDKKDQDFNKHQAVLQKLIQSMFKSIGSVFQAWKMFAKTKREDRLSKKAAKITSTILAKRGQGRLAFLSWARYCLQTRVKKLRFKEVQVEREHMLRMGDLKKQLSQSNDAIAHLKAEVHVLRTAQNKETGDQVILEEMQDDEGDDDIDSTTTRLNMSSSNSSSFRR
ncbi:hypothetical protein H257_14964 [Aphanomyces astaci]|uniref:Uncharacterized protein n=1 Tax=Aphanomyces astaci TaxID=112090 RepID=W4FPD9_APHAT|nr:hypothetical protein H257_14964 [Aphanomyces astaci]ETV69357.1 hypothetical protein H257_14964 [Aphanomyces astaci]|eukprot:XP_009841214.1 hypothetical protein H257_14964 [Aphanomyces astaci]